MKYVLLLFGALLVFVGLCMMYRRGRIVSTHVVNMESSRDRLVQFMAHSKKSGLSVVRWGAVNGKSLGEGDLAKYNLSKELYDSHKSNKRLGVIGCYLSHATLLQHLQTMRCNPNDIHLIFEDDVILPENTDLRVHQVINDLPAEWDLVQLFTLDPVTRPWKHNIHTPVPKAKGNWSTAAYAVRHGSLPKINEHIRVMRVPIDDQLMEKNGTWKWFCVQPDLVKIDDKGKTTLNDK